MLPSHHLYLFMHLSSGSSKCIYFPVNSVASFTYQQTSLTQFPKCMKYHYLLYVHPSKNVFTHNSQFTCQFNCSNSSSQNLKNRKKERGTKNKEKERKEGRENERKKKIGLKILRVTT